MTQLEALRTLAEKVEAGDDITARLWMRSFGINPDDRGVLASRAYHGSLDAAKVLHEAVLPEWVVNCLDQAANLAGSPWGCEVAYFDGPNPNNNMKSYSGHDYNNPARAWLLSILKAMISELENE